MYFCGIGETAVNTFLGALNLPCFPHNTENERKRGRSSFRAVADETCCEALLEEKSRQVSIIYYVLYSVRKLYNLLIVIVFIFIP